MNFKGILLTVPALMLCVSCGDNGSYDDDIAFGPQVNIVLKDGKFTDERDGKTYSVVKIGSDYWMAENLRYVDSSKTPNLKGGIWCYENSKDSCAKYGPLYSWTAAMNIEKKYVTEAYGNSNSKVTGICPEGWRLPTSRDWQQVLSATQNNMGVQTGVGIKTVEGWEVSDSASKPTNRFGFYGMPAGRRNSENGEFMSTGKYAFFWSSVEKDDGTSIGYALRYDSDYLSDGFYYKDHGMSVRCMQTPQYLTIEGDLDSAFLDEIPFEYGTLEYQGTEYKTIRIGEQNWMAENMAYDVEGSWCYNDDTTICKKFGRLYSYEQASEVCPEGWHLPSAAEFQALQNAVFYGSALRSREEWSDKGSQGWNLWGFNAYPAGGRESGDYFDKSLSSYMWTADKSVFWLRYYSEEIQFMPKDNKTAFSVRCLED